MRDILEVHNLTKHFPKSDFSLENVSFTLPCGSIMGFVGENGAGKTTTISCILNTLTKNDGSVKMFGIEMSDNDTDIREDIGVVFDAGNFSGILTANQLSKIMSNVYSRWDNYAFMGYMSRFRLPAGQKIKTYSRGMVMKLAIAVALAHSPKLLILDEATSGLDPIVRDEMLDVFLDFVKDETHSILLSSHITSDLEKIADYITFIHDGKIVFSARKDDLISRYGIIQCSTAQFSEIEGTDIVRYRERDNKVEVLVSDKLPIEQKYPEFTVDRVSIDDIILLYVKGEWV